MSKMRKEYDPNKAVRRKRIPIRHSNIGICFILKSGVDI